MSISISNLQPSTVWRAYITDLKDGALRTVGVNYFMSHGSPMNAIANNNYTKSVAKEGEKYKPSAIVVVSAH